MQDKVLLTYGGLRLGHLGRSGVCRFGDSVHGLQVCAFWLWSVVQATLLATVFAGDSVEQFAWSDEP